MQPSEEIAQGKIYAVIPFLSENWKNASTAKWLLYAATDVLENQQMLVACLARAFGDMENGEAILREVIQKLQEGHRVKYCYKKYCPNDDCPKDDKCGKLWRGGFNG